MGNSSEYLRNFRRFVENTNEKIEVARAINRIVQEKHPETMLDVGAGDGTLTSILAPALREVYTVEKRENHAQSLRNKGVTTFNEEFPCVLPAQYDLVIASHSVPFEKGKIEAFVEGLIAATKEKGTVVIVTYKTEKDPWFKLMRDALGENWYGQNLQYFENILDILRSHGEVHIEKVDSEVRAKTAEELFEALTFVYAGKDESLRKRFETFREQVIKELEKRYKNSREYRFPFHQFVITLNK